MSEIKNLIDLGVSNQSKIIDLFRRLRKVLQYRNSENIDDKASCGGRDDFGLPLPLLARLSERKPHILHNLLLWLYRHPEAEDEKSRLRMVRYALVDQLFLKVNIDYRRKSFTEIEKESIEFPDARLIALAADLNLLIQAFKSKRGDSKLLANSDDFKVEVNGKEDPADFTDLLLWVQRRYLYDKFPDYDPTLFYNVAALPWDKDHIWPQAKMNGRSDVREDRDKCKWSHLSSIGNLCLLDKRDNRGSRDLLPASKYVETSPKYLGISDSEFSDFCGLKLENDKVTTTFLKEFREVVEKRRAWLYQELYETLLLKDICRSPDPDGSLHSHT